MKKLLMFFVLIVALASGGWVLTDRVTFDRAAWIADFEQLKSATELSYANLYWSRPFKRVDLVALNAAAEHALQEATSNSAARHALATFINGFHDGHFRIERDPPAPVAAVLRRFARDARATTISTDMPAANACRALGFDAVGHELTITGAAPLARSTFAAGTVQTQSGRKFGIIRIPLFRQDEYGGTCERVWPQFQAGKPGTCDEDCQYEFDVAVKRELAQELADDARALISAGAEAVVIDLTGNGGGTEWAEFAAAALTAKPQTQTPLAFTRGPHWRKYFDEKLSWVDEMLKKEADAARRAELAAGREEVLAMLDSTSMDCDLGELWTNRDAQPACWNHVRMPASLRDVDQYEYQRPFSGRLFIMQDERTASASEQFAALLLDNGVAQTIGKRTMGAGCGYTNGGNPVTLKHSGLVIRMPDCARLRADGTNEYEGIKPDYPVAWGDDETSRTAALLGALDKLPTR